MNSILFIVLRRLRAPLIGLVGVYALTVLGLTLIPGVGPDGRPAPPMSFFHAFYFVSYTGTTIGFGEIPNAFSDAQRMWVTASIYFVVVAWSYTIISTIALLQDRAFQHALAVHRFGWRVRRLHEPFYIICGCGETGDILCRALDRLGRGFVVVEIDETRIQELELEDFRSDAPTLAADARSPEMLLLAGLRRPTCMGVIALTNDDEANLAVAMSVRLLAPKVPVLCRVHTRETAANMASFGTDHIINPFETFADYLMLAMRAPGCLRLMEWLTALPGAGLQAEHEPPRGAWVVCGYGRFGRAIAAALAQRGVEVTVVDPEIAGRAEGRVVAGLGTEAHTLTEAGIQEAAGLVAGTDSDINNLSIAVTAREIRPSLYVVARQNLKSNTVLFRELAPDVCMVVSEIIAHECLAILTSPLLSRFLDVVRTRDDAWADDVIERLRTHVGEAAPETWTVHLNAAGAPALHRALAVDGTSVPLSLLLRDPGGGIGPLPCVALLLVRDRKQIVLPDGDVELAPGDRLLFAGRDDARDLQYLALRNANALGFLLTGRDPASSWLWRRLTGAGG